MSTLNPTCGDESDHDSHQVMDWTTGNYRCPGVCNCGSLHPDIPKGPHGPGEHK